MKRAVLVLCAVLTAAPAAADTFLYFHGGRAYTGAFNERSIGCVTRVRIDNAGRGFQQIICPDWASKVSSIEFPIGTVKPNKFRYLQNGMIELY